MKGVILICLLSLSGCFSAPNQEAAAPTPKLTTLATATPDTSTHPIKEADSKPPAVVPEPTPATPQKDPAKNSTETVTPAPNAKNETTKDNKSAKDDITHKDATTVDPKSKNEANPTPAPVITTPTPTSPTTTSAAVPSKNETKPGDKEKEANTDKIEASTTAPKIVQASRSFDGASFIGGIILTLGLLAIGFMGFKYYKNQTERNYHTL